jgi:hypothetical protein
VTVQCVRCGSPLADGAYVCHDEAHNLAGALLAAAGHAEDASTLSERGARPGASSRGGGDTPLPDLTRSARYAHAAAAITRWARVVSEETGRRPRWRAAIGPLCPPNGRRCEHGSCEAIRRRTPPADVSLAAAWLAQQTGWLRKHPAAGEAFAQLHAACTTLARLIDVPPDKELVGMCDCGRVLYGRRDQVFVTCPVTTCKLRWNVAESRDILRDALDGKLVTAAEAARFGQYLDTDRTQEQIRKLINTWSSRGQIVAHGEIEGEPTFRFGDVSERLARTPRRAARAAESETAA